VKRRNWNQKVLGSVPGTTISLWGSLNQILRISYIYLALVGAHTHFGVTTHILTPPASGHMCHHFQLRVIAQSFIMLWDMMKIWLFVAASFSLSLTPSSLLFINLSFTHYLQHSVLSRLCINLCRSANVWVCVRVCVCVWVTLLTFLEDEFPLD